MDAHKDGCVQPWPRVQSRNRADFDCWSYDYVERREMQTFLEDRQSIADLMTG
jgi:hypothetical protein